jgi:predicted transcriptional regulator
MKLSSPHIKLTPPSVEMIIYMKNHGELTNSRSSLFKMQYYTIIWYLKKVGVVECIGVDDNNEKRWKLTEKGCKLAGHIEEILKLFEEKI